jgi:hypothetical protein
MRDGTCRKRDQAHAENSTNEPQGIFRHEAEAHRAHPDIADDRRIFVADLVAARGQPF